MNKNLFLRLYLMIAVFTLLHSCKTELLEDENTNPTNKFLSTKILHYKDLQQNTVLLKKLSTISGVNSHFENQRIYTDTEEGFSVDLDDCMFIKPPRKKILHF